MQASTNCSIDYEKQTNVYLVLAEFNCARK